MDVADEEIEAAMGQAEQDTAQETVDEVVEVEDGGGVAPQQVSPEREDGEGDIAEPEAEIDIDEEVRELYANGGEPEEEMIEEGGFDAFVLIGDEESGTTQLQRDTARATVALEFELHMDGGHAVCIDARSTLYCHLDAFVGFVLCNIWNTVEKIIKMPYNQLEPRFKEGIRHDAIGKWPAVEIDPETAGT